MPELELAQRELNYAGVARPNTGDTMGPGLNGRLWAVVGAMYDTAADKTTVSLVEIPRGALAGGLAS